MTNPNESIPVPTPDCPRDAMPTAGQIYKDQIALAESAEELEASFVERRAKSLY